MPTYDYRCEANGRTVEVNHPIDVVLNVWAEVCYVAQIGLDDTDPMAPVRKIISTAPYVNVPTGNTQLKELGFTKLVKRDQGVYENVTATGDEKRYFKAGEADTAPHLHKKIED